MSNTTKKPTYCVLSLNTEPKFFFGEYTEAFVYAEQIKKDGDSSVCFQCVPLSDNRIDARYLPKCTVKNGYMLGTLNAFCTYEIQFKIQLNFNDKFEFIII